jgi:hypothetical protein
MTDPVTIGTLAASALAIASDETVKGFVGEAVKDAYKNLRDKIAHWAGADVDALEKEPASKDQRGVVAQAVDGQPPEEQALVKALAAELLAALKSEAKKSEGVGPIGLEIGNLQALEVQLGAITVTEGIGARFKDVKTDIFTVDQIKAGAPPGKTDR